MICQEQLASNWSATPLAVTQPELLTPLLPPPLLPFRRLAWSVCHLLSWPQPPGRLFGSGGLQEARTRRHAQAQTLPALGTSPQLPLSKGSSLPL